MTVFSLRVLLKCLDTYIAGALGWRGVPCRGVTCSRSTPLLFYYSGFRWCEFPGSACVLD